MSVVAPSPCTLLTMGLQNVTTLAMLLNCLSSAFAGLHLWFYQYIEGTKAVHELVDIGLVVELESCAYQ